MSTTIIVTDGSGTNSVIAGAKPRKMHWIYFILFGWCIGMCAAGFIIPLFFPAGRRFVGACFGYW